MMSKYLLAEKIMETEDESILLQVQAILDEKEIGVTSQHIQMVREEMAEYKKSPEEGFSLEQAMQQLRARI